MPHTYRIKEKYAKTTINEQYTILSSESDSTVLQSPLAIQLLDAISHNTLSKEELIANFSTYSPNLSDVLIALHQLEAEGYITHSPPAFAPEQSAYWEELGYETQKLSQVFSNKSIQIIGIGDVDAQTLNTACKDTGLQISEHPFLTIVLTSDYLHPDLEGINQKMLAKKKPWILIKLTGTTPYIGPLMNPAANHAACWKCMQHRLLLHDQENKLYRALSKTNHTITRPKINHPLSIQIGIGQALLEIVSWLYHEKNDHLDNTLIAITPDGKQTYHQVVKRPQCNHCGDPQLVARHPLPIVLQEQKTVANNPGGYRTVTPKETLQKYQHHISNITGIVPYLKPYHPIENVPIYNFGSGKNLALHSSSLFWLNLHLRSANGGKGSTPIQAKTGALCEAIERYSLMYQGKTYTHFTSYNELEKAIDPNSCMLYSEQQYQQREQINKESTKFYSLIPIPFDRDKKMDWTPVYNLTKNEFEYLPSCYCFAQYPAEDENKLYAYPDSNGCAAGNTIEESILQGFLELVERDAAAIWWYNRIQYQTVDLASANNSYIDEMIEYYKSSNRSLYVLDITTDINIPVFVAISHDLSTDSADKILYAFGAHVDVNIALERAVIELNQLLPIVTKKEDEYLTSDQVFINWLDTATLKENPYLLPLDGKAKNIQTDYPTQCNPTVYDSVTLCIDKTKKLGLETLVVDLTQPDVGLPVAKVIVPGLRHFWRRTAPGRLYEVPLKMGTLKHAHTEEELNPWSIFI